MPDFKLHPIDITIVGIYIVFVVWFGFRIGKKHKSAEDYFLAGRSMIWPFIGISLFASNIFSTTLIATDVLKAMEADSGIRLKELRVDGGASVNNLLMQIQADLLGVPVIRPKITETTALGAAYLAGLAVGFWKDRGEIEQHWQIETKFEPKMSNNQIEKLYYGWLEAVNRSKGWVKRKVSLN